MYSSQTRVFVSRIWAVPIRPAVRLRSSPSESEQRSVELGIGEFAVSLFQTTFELILRFRVELLWPFLKKKPPGFRHSGCETGVGSLFDSATCGSALTSVHIASGLKRGSTGNRRYANEFKLGFPHILAWGSPMD